MWWYVQDNESNKLESSFNPFLRMFYYIIEFYAGLAPRENLSQPFAL